MSAQQEKDRLRSRIREDRSARPAHERALAAEATATHVASLISSLPGADPALVSAYLSLPTEPGTDPLIAALCARGHAVWVPRILGADLEWVSFRPGDPVQSGPMGIREPLGGAVDSTDLGGLDVMIIPALAVDHDGHRLGKGGGFYDRVLSALPRHSDGGPLRVALLHDGEIHDHVPHESHDAPVDAALTPQGLQRF